METDTTNMPPSAPEWEERVIECRICGEPLTVKVDTSLDPETAAIMWRIAKNAAHDECVRDEKVRAEDARQSKIITDRMTAWKRLCPVLYQNNDMARLRKKHGTKLDVILGWTFNPQGLFLWGASRAGKTRCMWAMLRKQFQQQKAIVAMTHSEFAQRAIALDAGDNRKWQRILCTADILFIDDLGKGKLTTREGAASQAEEALFHVFDQRINNELPTCWTSEWDAADLKARFSKERAESLTARLIEFSQDIQLRK